MYKSKYHIMVNAQKKYNGKYIKKNTINSLEKWK